MPKTIKPTMKSNYDIISEINNLKTGIWFDKIIGYSLVGDVRSGADVHPIQYFAYTNIPDGSDDAFEGSGWTPSEAFRNLLKSLNQL